MNDRKRQTEETREEKKARNSFTQTRIFDRYQTHTRLNGIQPRQVMSAWIMWKLYGAEHRYVPNGWKKIIQRRYKVSTKPEGGRNWISIWKRKERGRVWKMMRKMRIREMSMKICYIITSTSRWKLEIILMSRYFQSGELIFTQLKSSRQQPANSNCHSIVKGHT